jgi:hypothetical protein
MRVSTTAAGGQGYGHSSSSTTSDDGRFVAFESTAPNLVPGDTNGFSDIFVRDLATGSIQRISVGAGGEQGNQDSDAPVISGDGRFVLFSTFATNLVLGDLTPLEPDALLYDRQTGVVEIAGLGSNGLPAATHYTWGTSISADGRFVVFESIDDGLVTGDTNDSSDVYVRDRWNGTTERVSVSSTGGQGDSDSYSGAISSADGRYVAFDSFATNLVGGDTNGHRYVFVHDRLTGDTECVSFNLANLAADDDSYSPSISADGRIIGFESWASNLVANDTNAWCDAFVRDRATHTTRRISVSPTLGDADDLSENVLISGDGKHATFCSLASNLVTGDTNGLRDIFVRDLIDEVTERVSVGLQGQSSVGPWGSYRSSSSFDAHVISFSSDATNLVPNDTNSSSDVFARVRTGPLAWTYCSAKLNSLGCMPSIGYVGSPSFAGLQEFDVTASNLRNFRTGMMFWGRVSTAMPFQGVRMCIASPLHRTPLRDSGGNIDVEDCSGTLSFALTHDYAVLNDIQSGDDIYAQYWSRDPNSAPHYTSLTDALHFVVGP